MTEWLNANAGSISLLFSLVVAISTVFYAVLTWRLVTETRRMREAQTEPRVLVQVQPSEQNINLINMSVINAGDGPAFDVHLSVSPDFEWDTGRFLSEYGLFRNGITYLAPRQQTTQFLTSASDGVHDKNGGLEGIRFSIAVEYRNSIGRLYRDAYTISFDHLLGMIQADSPADERIAESVETLARSLKRLGTAGHRFEVVIRTPDDIRTEHERYVSGRKERNKGKGRSATDPDGGGHSV